MMILHIISLFLAIGITPWLVSQLLVQRHSWGALLAGWGPVMISINIAIPILLHLLAFPITPNSLALAHSILAGFIILLALLFKRPAPLPVSGIMTNRFLMAGAILFALLVLPLTHIAGIDTYKWQDLAGNITVEQRLSWLVHPLSLLGFTPRSYSSAQPLILASIQMLGHTGVDWGFYILSLAFGLTGLSGAWMLGRYLFKSETSATWLALLYLFSPVFMRYNYWATGRGLLLDLLPVYLLILLKLGSVFTDKSTRQWSCLTWLIPAWLLLSSLLMMSHKAGVIGACLIPILFLSSPALMILRGRWALLIAGLLALAAGLLLTNSQPITLATRLITRFGWLLPLAILAIFTKPNQILTPPFRTLLTAGLLLLALSCTPDMYGALLALPFITCLATVGLEKINGTLRSYALLGLLLIPALAIVLNQMRDSPAESVYQAAQFIENHDPRGPFRIEAPGAARRQIQAYVSGCPRFAVNSGSQPQLEFNAMPSWTGKLSLDARHWIDYLRNMLGLRGATTDWYGSGTKIYYITIDGQGTIPPNPTRLFSNGNVTVFE